MIVRTYTRRNRCISRTFSDSSFDGGVMEDSVSQESLSQEIYPVPFSSQDSSQWSLDADLNGSDTFSLLPPPPPRPAPVKKPSKKPKNLRSSSSTMVRSSSVPTSTLMEAQEFGEMMEHVDEVNFALDGLRPGHPARVRRGSLLSLLSICGSAVQRRLLRAKGMMKTIIDAILGLTFDDSPSTLAASALFYVLASDGQDEYLLDSTPCIRFLLKLLNPPTSDSIEDKAPSFGGKLLAIRNGPGILRGMTQRLDSSATAIISKVQEILLSCKEVKPSNRDDDGIGRPELSSKWISLLTMEKACLSTVSLEDTSGIVRRVGGNFKERLRELGGLDAVFDVAASCHSVMEGWLKHGFPSFRESKDDAALRSVVLLLKCLKIMENATFLSKDNQNHLLGMSAKSDREGLPISFVGLIISAIKILSGLSLLQNSSSISNDKKSNNLLGGVKAQSSPASEVQLQAVHKGDRNGISSSNSIGGCIMRASLINSSRLSLKRQRLSTSQSESSISGSESTTTSGSDVYLTMKGDNSLGPISCNGTLRGSNRGTSTYANGSKMDSVRLGKRPHLSGDDKCKALEDSQDPFAFNEFDDPEPTKWEVPSTKKAPRAHKSRLINRELEDGHDLQLVTSNSDPVNEVTQHSVGASCSSVAEEEDSGLLDDCLLTAVKVLMNLTNDNPDGCQQIADCGGLDTMAALIIGHFPLFGACLSTNNQMKESISFSKIESNDPDNQNGKHLADQELDFLVAILGLLVNLVEKDSRNRSRLAAASVPLPRSGGAEGEENNRDVIPLLCSIFLANQGAGEAAGEGRQLEWDDEDALLQGEREAEKMIIEAYAALLLAFLSTESTDIREAIACCLPDGKLRVLVPVLERFVAFHLTLNMISPESHTAVSEVIESCRGP
ncbi:wings apart-like protein 1 [Magnolia sinica]|uniref:wings apart-like protein 1 n=1 Tax=Magnolia sinica TaxID=86752 RepID=UPI00265A3805|nr:wings apart-like protein 1 [Magnolia sinica]